MIAQLRIKRRKYVAHVDDERGLGHGIIVTLEEPWCFKADPTCGVRGFDTLTEALQGTTSDDVYQPRGGGNTAQEVA